MQAEKQYNRLAEILHGLEAHPAQPALDKNAAWKKLQAKRQPAIAHWAWVVAAILLLAVVVGWLYQRPQVYTLPKDVAKAPVLAAPKLTEITATSHTDTAASPVIRKKQKKVVVKEAAPLRVLGPIPTIAKEEIVIDTAIQIAVAQPPTLQAPKPASKKIFHLNELRDPDRPYTVQDKKLRSTTPVAGRTERPFIIKFNLSN